MNEIYVAKSAKNFEMLGTDLTIDFLYDNLRPVAKRSIVRNVAVAILVDIYDLSVSRVCTALQYHRNSYYGVRNQFEKKLGRPEANITERVIKTYNLRDQMKTIVNPIDPVTIVEASEELLDLLEIDAIVRAQLKK